jgi:hypothetical protein
LQALQVGQKCGTIYNRLLRVVWASLIAVATAFTVVLGLGFWLRPQVPSISDDTFGLIAGIAIPALSGAIFCAILRISPWKPATRAFDRFLYRLQNPPPKPLPPGVDRRSPAQIAYALDRNLTASCSHLEPIEHAMRLAGIDVQLLDVSIYAPIVKANCRINLPALTQLLSLSPSIYYKEGYQPERHEFDNPRADITCRECLISDRERCDILVLHPDECRPDTPWFPSPPAQPPPLTKST